jgi:hypothetical protein
MKTKKSLIVAASFALALAFTPSVVFAQQGYPQQADNSEQRAKVAMLIRDGVKKNKEAIQRESSSLSFADKEALYNKHRKKAAGGWAALDFFIGFGIGSYIQGDIGFGVTQSILDGAGYLLLINGFSAWTEVGKCEDKMDRGEEDSCGNRGTSGIVMACGGISLVTSRIMSFIMPFSFQKKQNKNLREALNHDKYAFSIAPLIVPSKGGGAPALGLGFNVKY